MASRWLQSSPWRPPTVVALAVTLSVSLSAAMLGWPAPHSEPPVDPAQVSDAARPLSSILGGDSDGESVFDAISEDYRAAVAEIAAPTPERYSLVDSVPPGLFEPFSAQIDGGYIAVADYGAQLAALAWLCAWEQEVRVSLHEGDGVALAEATDRVLSWPDLPLVAEVLPDFAQAWTARIGDPLREGDVLSVEDDIRQTCVGTAGELVVPPVRASLENPVSMAYRQTLADIPLALPPGIEVAPRITGGYGESMSSSEAGRDGEFGAYIASMAWLCAWETALVHARASEDLWMVQHASDVILQWPSLPFVKSRMTGQVGAWVHEVATPLRAGNLEAVAANQVNTCSRLPAGLVTPSAWWRLYSG